MPQKVPEPGLVSPQVRTYQGAIDGATSGLQEVLEVRLCLQIRWAIPEILFKKVWKKMCNKNQNSNTPAGNGLINSQTPPKLAEIIRATWPGLFMNKRKAP